MRKLIVNNFVTVDGYYDRAALVALPPEMRARYVAHVAALLPSGARGLLVSFEYLPAEGGPPFSVPEVPSTKPANGSFDMKPTTSALAATAAAS